MIPKFRAWDKELHRWGEIFFICSEGGLYTPESPFKENREKTWGYPIARQERFIIMQSTGLKDKNGVEIFDGDIIVAMSQGVKVIGEVKRRIDGYWLMYPAWQHGEFWHIVENVDTGETGVEVIGNIYENPELLQ